MSEPAPPADDQLPAEPAQEAPTPASPPPSPPEATPSPPAPAPEEQAAGPAEPDPQGGQKPARKERPPLPPGLVVRYGFMGQVGFFRRNMADPPPPGAKVVVRSERGVELGEVICGVDKQSRCGCISPDRLGEYILANGSEYPFRRDGKVLRPANAQDLIDQRHLESSAVEEGSFCREQIKEMKLAMKLVRVEHLLGGERIIFYFSAEHRVDFRDLVRRLASQFRTRIEMRQVGARDEARLVADFERCGRPCCCRQFLKKLKPVSMRMAKTQKATLDPSKISGRCGRLMCCLRYEDAGYEDLRKKLPRRNTWVRTAELVGKVTETQILTQLVQLVTSDGVPVVIANEEIVERDFEPPQPPSKGEKPAEDEPTRRKEARRGAGLVSAKARAAQVAAVPLASPQAAPAAAAPSAAGDQQATEGGDQAKKHRRRRRRGGKAAAARARPQQQPGGAQEAKPAGKKTARGGNDPQKAAQQQAVPSGEARGEKKSHTPPKRRRRRGSQKKGGS